MSKTYVLRAHQAENNRMVLPGTRLYNHTSKLKLCLFVNRETPNANSRPAFQADQKIIPFSDLRAWRQSMREQGLNLVVTNGCFDLLHAGHVRYLETARNLGDALLVGLNGDDSVRSLKGEGRPINPEDDRAVVLASLGCVTAVSIFPEVRADRFLEQASPDQYVKGGDYTVETLDSNERRVVEEAGGEIVILSFVPGKSTTATLKRIKAANQRS